MVAKVHGGKGACHVGWTGHIYKGSGIYLTSDASSLKWTPDSPGELGHSRSFGCGHSSQEHVNTVESISSMATGNTTSNKPTARRTVASSLQH